MWLFQGWASRNKQAAFLLHTATMEISIVISQKIWNQSTSRPALPLLGIYPKNAQSYHKYACSTMFIAALFIITRTWKQPRCPANMEWIKKMWCIDTMEYYSSVNNNAIIKFAGKCMELERKHPEWDNLNTEKQTWYVALIRRCKPKDNQTIIQSSRATMKQGGP